MGIAGITVFSGIAAVIIFIVVYRIIARQRGIDRPDLPDLPAFTADDRILILAPHEDDESLGPGGLIQRAVEAGAAVHVAYLTNGDHNQLAFVLYRGRPWLSPKVNIHMGEVRRTEAIAAMDSLGLTEDHLTFLGYPDHDTLTIWKRHWGDAPPLHSILTDSRAVPYPKAFSYRKPYKGESILEDIQTLLGKFRPTHILVTHPVDANPDHQAYFLFLQAALFHLDSKPPAPRVMTYPVHMGRWPRPRDYYPDMWLAFPERLADGKREAYSIELTPRQTEMKHRAISIYKSQMSDSASWLVAFARKNEFFVFMAPELLPVEPGRTANSPAVAGAALPGYETDTSGRAGPGVSYSRTGSALIARINLVRELRRRMNVSLYVFGARKDRPFGDMPKLHVEHKKDTLRVYDQQTPVSTESIKMNADEEGVSLTIPWELLGYPELVFVQAHSFSGGMERYYTRWHVFRLMDNETGGQ
jgi:LmbE family N-acetylglucosaminyl deacetylase